MIFTLNTGRTIQQGNTVEMKYHPDYAKEVSGCHMNPLDMLDLGVMDGERVRVTGPAGSVVMHIVQDETVSHSTVFVPYGIYANQVISTETHGTGMPDFKTIEADLEPTEDSVLTVPELLRALGGMPYIA